MTKKKTRELVQKTFYDNNGNPEKQLKEFKKLLKSAQESGDFYFAGLVFHMLAVVYNMLGDREKLFLNAVKSLALLKDSDDWINIATAYVTLGAAYSRQENYQLALVNYDKAYDIYKRHRYQGPNRIMVLNNLSSIHNRLGDYASGIRYLNECIELAKEYPSKNAEELPMYKSNLAYTYIRMGEYEKAAQILEEGKAGLENISFQPFICMYHLKCALAYYYLMDKRKGGKDLDIALSIAKESPDLFLIYDDLGELTPLLLQNKDRKRAETVIGLMTEYGKRNRQTMEQLLVSSTLADYYRSIGETERAVDYYAQALELSNTRANELKQAQLNIHKILKDADSSINRLNKKVIETENRANRDPMTKLLNRSAMLKVSEEFIEKAAKNKEKIGAIFIDIDFFKECNDTYGHAKGDEIIKEVARACQKEESEQIRFARYGGDEFLGLTCCLEDGAVTEIARRICSRIRKADIPNQKNPNGHRVTLSVGIVNVAVTKKTDTIIQIANYADKAVYYSKNAGKDCIHLLDYGRRNAKNKNDPFVKIEF